MPAIASSWVEDLANRLQEMLGGVVEIDRLVLLPGGASKEAWAVDLRSDVGRRALLVRRAGNSVIHGHTLSLEQEYRVLEVAHAAGVLVPRPCAYLGELGGREAFAMERVDGETIGRRIVTRPEHARACAALPEQLAEQLALIHAVPVADVSFLPGPVSADGVIGRLLDELDALDEPHPAIELGLARLRDRLPPEREPVLAHGDFRIGNVVVGGEALEAVLDWEFAHIGAPASDVAWPLVRAWRFGVDERRLGGIGDPEPYLTRYGELTGRELNPSEVRWWELAGNLRWAVGALTQARRHLSGRETSVEFATLGRMAAEIEYEILDLLERTD